MPPKKWSYQGVFTFFLSLWIFFNLNTHVFAQNLVPNPGFEQVLKPHKTRYPGTIEQASPWFTVGKGSPDLIKVGGGTNEKLPAAEGSNYAGIMVYDEANANFREYLQVKFLAPLQQGKEYCVRIKVSLARDAFYSIDRLGIYFSSDTVKSKNWYVIEKPVQLKTPDYKALNDTSKWMQFDWKFISEGFERFMVIGNFNNDVNTNLITNNRKSYFKTAYLFIDDVFVGLCNPEPEPTFTKTDKQSGSVKMNREGRLFIPNVLTPNQDGFNDVFEIDGLPLYAQLIIRNLKGEEVYKTNNYRNDWNADGVPAGKYNYELRLPDGNVVFGVIDVVRTKKKP